MNLKQRAGMMGLALFLPLVVGMAVACGAASQPPPAAEIAAPTAAPVAPAQPARPSGQESAVKDTPAAPASQEASGQMPAEIHIANTSPYDDAASCEPDGDLLCTDWIAAGRAYSTSEPALNSARQYFPSPLYTIGAHHHVDLPPGVKERPPGADWRNTPPGVDWQAMAEAAASRACAARGYEFYSATFDIGHNENRGDDAMYNLASLGWFFKRMEHPQNGSFWRYEARQSRTWTGVCRKAGN